MFVDELAVEEPKTKADGRYSGCAGRAKASALVLLPERNENVERSIRNLSERMYLRASYLNVRDLLQFDRVIIPLGRWTSSSAFWGARQSIGVTA